MRIFISSTFSDLANYRDVVHSSIRKLRNHAEDMISWTADDRSAIEVSLENIIQSNLVILLLAHRYGTVPSGESASFVDLEYTTAKENGIPVLAFFIDPQFPWPPSEIEFDAENRAKLVALKKKVESECVRQFFTTPESLAVAVSQAVANFDRRERGSEQDLGIRITQPVVRRRLDIPHYENLNVLLGEAEDGLPLIFTIERSQPIKTPLTEIAKSLNTNLDDPPLSSIHKTITAEGKRIWRASGIHDVTLPDGRKESCYISYQNLTKFFAPSLATKLLTGANEGRSISISRPRESASFPDSSSTVSTSIVARYGPDQRVQSTGGSNRFLALPVDGDHVYVVGWKYDRENDQSELEYWRDFVNESILLLSECKYQILFSRTLVRPAVMATATHKTYRSQLTQILEKTRYYEDKRFVTRLQVPRNSLNQLILMAATALTEIHSTGSIHGDIKPQNILLSKNGIHLIDSLCLYAGELSPGLSPDWAAPEQLMMQPVCNGTDIFPLGLMLSMVLGAQLTGEYLQYMLPTRKAEPFIIPILRNPILYLGPKDQKLTLEGRRAWFNFIEHCLKFDPSERLNNAETFVEKLEALSRDHPVSGYVAIELESNLLSEFAILPDGKETPCRQLTDHWSTLTRTIGEPY